MPYSVRSGPILSDELGEPTVHIPTHAGNEAGHRIGRKKGNHIAHICSFAGSLHRQLSREIGKDLFLVLADIGDKFERQFLPQRGPDECRIDAVDPYIGPIICAQVFVSESIAALAEL